MELVLSTITNVFSTALGFVADVADTVVAEPLLLIWFVLPLVGIGVGLFKRLVSLH